MICAYCGTDLPEAAMFCGECGRAVVTKVATKSRARVSSAAAPSGTRWPSAVAEHHSASRPNFAEEPGAFEIDLLAPTPTPVAVTEDAAPDLVEPVREAPEAGAADVSFGTVAPDSPVEPAATVAGEPSSSEVPEYSSESYSSESSSSESEPPLALQDDWAPERAPLQEFDAEQHVETSDDSPEAVDPLWELPGAPLSVAVADMVLTPELQQSGESPAAAEIVSAPAAEAPVAAPSPWASVPSAGAGDNVEELVERDRPQERCAQCGSALAASDIFCGECGFVRRPADAAPPRPRDTAAYDPFPWGLPRDEQVVAAPRPPVEPERAPEPQAPPVPEYVAPVAPPASGVAARIDDDLDSDVEKTRIVDRAARGDTFVLQFSTGENVTVSGTGLIGRNPLAEPGEYFDSLVAIIDPGKSVSKTHLEFGQESGAFWISDRYSANGTVVREPDRPARRGEAGKRYRVVRGTRIDIGEQFFIVS